MPHVTTLSLYNSLNIKNFSYLIQSTITFQFIRGCYFSFAELSEKKNLKFHKQLSTILNPKQPRFLFKHTSQCYSHHRVFHSAWSCRCMGFLCYCRKTSVTQWLPLAWFQILLWVKWEPDMSHVEVSVEALSSVICLLSMSQCLCFSTCCTSSFHESWSAWISHLKHWHEGFLKSHNCWVKHITFSVLKQRETS